MMAAGFCLACHTHVATVERHHVLGAVNSDLSVNLCRPHHREATEYLRAAGVSMRYEASGSAHAYALAVGVAVLVEMVTRGILLPHGTDLSTITTRLVRSTVTMLSVLSGSDIDARTRIPTATAQFSKWSAAFERDLSAFLIALTDEVETWTP